MISITIILAGSLFILISTQPQNSPAWVPLGTTIARQSTGNWTLTVSNGRTVAANAILTIQNPDTGAATLSSSVTAHSWYFVYNDNNGNSMLDAGDIILLNQTAGVIEPFWRVEIVKYEGTLSGPLTLPP
jgi:hypothetical protein